MNDSTTSDAPTTGTQQRPVHGLEGLVPSDAELVRLGTGATWSEGPVWMPETNRIRWSDIPGNRILECDAETGETSVYATDVEFTNGRTLDLEGAVVQCSHGNRRVERDRDGQISVVADHYTDQFGTHRLNSPNDVVVAADGSVWFSDPPYGITVEIEGHPGEREYKDCFVFRLDEQTGELRPMITDIEEPNGLAFSPDGSTVYVSDTSAASYEGGNHHIRAYDLKDGRCKNGRVFAVIEEGLSDGFRVDDHGNIWTSSLTGVLVYSPAGELLGKIDVPEKVANVCFGGADGTTLFIAATSSIYRIQTTVHDVNRHGPAPHAVR